MKAHFNEDVYVWQWQRQPYKNEGTTKQNNDALIILISYLQLKKKIK